MADDWACGGRVVAVLYYGAARHRDTAPHNRLNVLRPLADQLGGVDVFIHTMLTKSIHNARSGENHSAPVSPRLIFDFGPACGLVADDQGEADVHALGGTLRDWARHSNYSRSNGASTAKNVLRALYSLQRCAALATAHVLK